MGRAGGKIFAIILINIRLSLDLNSQDFLSHKYFHHKLAHLLIKPLDWRKVIGASTGDLESPDSRY